MIANECNLYFLTLFLVGFGVKVMKTVWCVMASSKVIIFQNGHFYMNDDMMQVVLMQ